MNKLLLFLMILLTSNIKNDDKNVTKKYTHLTSDDSVHRMVKHPAFKGFGQFLLPWDNGANDLNTPLRNIGSLMPYHNHVDPNIVVAAMNHMIGEVTDGKTIFYDFYTEREKKGATAKASTGLFFFRGNPGAPFAIVCPGGGFAYVGSLHEGFPHAFELSKKGYNAFVLKYRSGSELKATEDLAAALSYILKNADMFQVSIANYSLWGSSAGARMVGNIALSGPAEPGGVDLQKPRIVVIAYTGHTIREIPRMRSSAF